MIYNVPASQHPSPEIGKAQWLRVADVLILGPAMIAAGLGWRPRGWLAAASIVGGVLTIIYNAENFARVESRGFVGGLSVST
jgi:hypothetical protein